MQQPLPELAPHDVVLLLGRAPRERRELALAGRVKLLQGAALERGVRVRPREVALAAAAVVAAAGDLRIDEGREQLGGQALREVAARVLELGQVSVGAGAATALLLAAAAAAAAVCALLLLLLAALTILLLLRLLAACAAAAAVTTALSSAGRALRERVEHALDARAQAPRLGGVRGGLTLEGLPVEQLLERC